MTLFKLQCGAVLLLLAACSPALDDAQETVAPKPAAAAEDQPFIRTHWTRKLRGVFNSSPRTWDFNADGVLDIAIGIGHEGVDGAVIVLDGTNGKRIIRRAYEDEVYASPLLYDVDGDGQHDLVTGRRAKSRRSGSGALRPVEGETGNAAVFAISGRDGTPIWDLRSANPGMDFPPTNINTTTPCPDLDEDGRRDLIVLQAGGDDLRRFPGVLYFVSSASGRVLRRLTMPDGNESYAVPALERVAGDEDAYRLFVGTGGERHPGHVICLDFPSLEEQWSYGSRAIKGFVAALVLHDFEGGGVRDVLAMQFSGILHRIDGATGEPVWRVRKRGFESYVTPVLGRFNDDEVLDVFAVFTEGKLPNYDTLALAVWVDGKTGEILDEKEVGVAGISSAVVADLDGDGLDEVVYLTNLSFGDRATSRSRLDIFAGREGHPSLHSQDFVGQAASTPWLGDLDADGILDLVVVVYDQVTRFELPQAVSDRVRVGEYVGTHYAGMPADEGGPR